MLEDKLEDVLKHQFDGFLNLALRNIWLFSKNSHVQSPANIDTRCSQISAHLRRLGLQHDIYCSGGELSGGTRRGRELCGLLNTLTRKLSSKALGKLAETKDENAKLKILYWISWRTCGFRICDLKHISYRKRRVRALKVLVELNLATKRNNEYYSTLLGDDIAREILNLRHIWVYEPLVQLPYYFVRTRGLPLRSDWVYGEYR